MIRRSFCSRRRRVYHGKETPMIFVGWDKAEPNSDRTVIWRNKMIIGVDCDGTIFEHVYPQLGDPVPGAIEKLKLFIEHGHHIILWTMRSGLALETALAGLEEHGIELWGVNKNPQQFSWTTSPKAYCNVYIDDAAFGCPLIYPGNGRRPYVDWSKITLESLVNKEARL